MAAFPKDTRRKPVVVNLEYIHRGNGVAYRRQVFDGPTFHVGDDVKIKHVYARVVATQHEFSEDNWKWSTGVSLGKWHGDLDSLRKLGFSKKPEN